MDNRVYWVWLTMVLGAANMHFWTMSDRYDGIEEFCRAVEGGEPEEMSERDKNSAKSITLDDARRLIEKCESKGISVVAYDSDIYPERLRWIPSPPPVLFMRGLAEALSASAVIAVVGARKPCEYSLEVTRRICGQLAKMGVTVISGYESGIDIAANKAAAEAGGLTAAVCGRGIYDSRANDGFGGLIEKNGVLLSEFTDTSDFNYVRFEYRNRILCGLADGVLFVECSAESQGLNNAAHARILGRPIFAIPPADIAERRFFGQRNLIRSGAVPVFDAGDILLALKDSGKAGDIMLLGTEDNINKKTSGIKGKNKIPAKNLKKVQKNAQEGLQKSENSVTINMSGLNGCQQEICRMLGSGAMHLNIMAERLAMPVNVLINELTMLQLKRIVEELPGKQYRLKK